MNNEELFEQLCSDVRVLKNYLTGDIVNNQYEEGLIDKVNRHDKLFKVMIWLCSISTIALISGCAKIIFEL